MKKSLKIILLLCLLIGALVLVNRDMFRFEEIFVYRRSFSRETDSKGDYILSTEQLALKPGTYQITAEGIFKGSGSGLFLIDAADQKILAVDLPSEGTMIREEITISGTAAQVRFGISWDPGTEELYLDRFLVRSDRVLYRSTLLKHAVISAAVISIGLILLLRLLLPEKYKSLFPHLSKPENERMVVMILLLTLLTAAPFYRSDTYVNGDDFYYHMRHLKGIAASLRAGHFPVRILLDWLENYGYGSGFYYPNIFLTLPAILILCGFHVIAAYEIFTTICTFFSLFTMFLTVRRVSGSEKAAHASILIYAFAAYRLTDIYYRAALGEIQAFVFLPLVILGLYEIFSGHTEKWWIFAAAFTGLLCCHVISLALAGVFTALWLLFCIRRIFSDKKIFFALVKAVLLTLGLGAWFLLPMAEQSATNQLKINTIMFSADSEPFGSSTDPRSLLLFFYDWNYVDPLRKVYPGWTLLIIPLLRLLFLRGKRSRTLKLADWMTLYGFITMIMCTSIFPWKIFIQFLYRIQFAWRIMMISTVLLSVSCGIYTALLIDRYLADRSPVTRFAPVFILCLVCGGPILLEALTVHVYPMDNYRHIERSNFLSGSEYLPENLKRETVEKTGDNVLCDVPGFEMTSFTRKGLSVTWDYRLPGGSRDAVMQVPLIYYTGYRGFLTPEDGPTEEIPLSKNNIGLITVTNGDTAAGRINVRYVKTLMQHIGDSISLVSLAGCFLYPLFRRRKSVK